jgi:glyoxylase-like metal-dependent hydrolase (beta-lactamase superfamily II)
VAYTGHVEAGSGEPSVRELPGLTVTKVSVGPMDNSCYLLTCTATGERLLVDAANDAGALLAIAPHLDTIVTTHQHGDHWQALAEVAAATGAATVAHPLDAPGLPVEPTRLVEQGDTIRVGEQTLKVIHLRGHTPGSIALHWSAGPADAPESHLWTGDCLFPGGVGNTQKDPGRFAQLLDDVEMRVFDVLPDETWVYPGHGDDTTLGAERPHLADWRDRGW